MYSLETFVTIHNYLRAHSSILAKYIIINIPTNEKTQPSANCILHPRIQRLYILSGG